MKEKRNVYTGDDFLLSTDTAKLLYHNYAAQIPIIDYHCHCSPAEIAQNRHYENITQLWLGGDHYKWRAMRLCGVDEKYITGDAPDYEKFLEFARIMPLLIGNPLYHWCRLELSRYFGWEGVLSSATAAEVWQITSEILAKPDMGVRDIIAKSNVSLLCTTDDPTDSLEHHIALAADTSFPVKVLPAFRPDKGMNIDRPGFYEYICKLSDMSGVKIKSFSDLLEAYSQRLDWFNLLGCRTADHAFDEYIVYDRSTSVSQKNTIAEVALRQALEGTPVAPEMADEYRSALIHFFAAEYKRRGWVMQIHYGAMRNTNSEMFGKLGPDTGFDTIFGRSSAPQLSFLLNALNNANSLPRTILYSLNPSENEAVAALCGCFPGSGDGMPLVTQGSAWWFNDNLRGMRAQLSSFASLAPLGKFIGMLTDSRSFVSYPRHEYFRRILCDYLGGLVENGEYPEDFEALAQIVCDICYNNTKRFFNFNVQ